MAELYTQTSPERSDLIPVADAVNPPEGYIGSMLLPAQKVSQPSGTMYYHAVVADGTAQTSRVTGVAPTGTQIAQSSTTFTVGEIIARGLVAPNQVEIMGGIENADRIGATFAVRSVMKKKETLICAATLGLTASATFDGSSSRSARGGPFLTAQKPQLLVQVSPRMRKVAVLAVQHSAILGHLALWQMVWR